MTIQAYPLQWPEGWPRTAEHERAFGRFGVKSHNGHWSSKQDISLSKANARIHEQLEKLDGPSRSWNKIDPDSIVVSTNLKVRKSDGGIAGSQREPDDPGVAVYFTLSGKPQCIPCDTYTKVAQNLAAVAATIDALRAIERHGSGLMERAFTGFAALPDQTNGAWWAILGVAPDASRETVEAAYREKRRRAHPDKPGGSHDEFVRVTEAWEQYQRETR